MKKVISLLLAIAMTSALLCSAASALGANAAPADAVVTVDGTPHSFEAYNIGGSNYFKLRDIAAILSGSKSQFGVAWINDTVTLELGGSYVSVGSELKGPASSAKTALPKQTGVSIDGCTVPMSAYNIEGNNFFKLRDIAEIIGFDVGWDGAANCISVTTGKAYALPDSFTGVGLNSYPLLLIGKTRAAIEEALGQPVSHEGESAVYPKTDVFAGGLKISYNYYTDRCNYVSGPLSAIVTNCPDSISAYELSRIFDGCYIQDDSLNLGYMLYSNYGGSLLSICSFKDKPFASDDAFHFSSGIEYYKPENAVEPKPAADPWDAAYDAKIKEYKDALASGDVDKMPIDLNRYLLGECLRNGGRLEAAEYDVNADGIPELFIAATIKSGYAVPEREIIDFYTFDGAKTVRPLEDETLGHRSFLKITADGKVMNHGSGGAGLSICKFYKLSGSKLTFSSGFYYSYEDDPYYASWTRVSVEEYSSKLKSVETIEDSFNWVKTAVAQG